MTNHWCTVSTADEDKGVSMAGTSVTSPRKERETTMHDRALSNGFLTLDSDSGFPGSDRGLVHNTTKQPYHVHDSPSSAKTASSSQSSFIAIQEE